MLDPIPGEGINNAAVEPVQLLSSAFRRLQKSLPKVLAREPGVERLRELRAFDVMLNTFLSGRL
jgi:hypothetical protein